MNGIESAESFYEQVNHARYSGREEGHYESFFLRANHPSRPLAFWIRYTIYSPAYKQESALGELWAVFFNGETGMHVAVKEEMPMKDCRFSTTSFNVMVGDARLSPRSLFGAVYNDGGAVSWDLSYEGESSPLLLLPRDLYEARLPKAKSLVGLPMAVFNGNVRVNGETIDVEGWTGSQNHNWGSKHTDLYAWGQVAGFDTHPESFLEVATARIKIGPFLMPAFTPIVLRHKGREYALNGLLQSAKARGVFDYFTWSFRSKTRDVEVEGAMSAPREAFVGLSYRNPPGGIKQCLNTKIASCTLTVRDRHSGASETLEAASRAAFEILTDDTRHGVALAV